MVRHALLTSPKLSLSDFLPKEEGYWTHTINHVPLQNLLNTYEAVCVIRDEQPTPEEFRRILDSFDENSQKDGNPWWWDTFNPYLVKKYMNGSQRV